MGRVRTCSLGTVICLMSCGALILSARGDPQTYPAYRDPHKRIVEASPRDDIPAIVNQASPGTTILLNSGTYHLSSTLQFRFPDVTLRSKSGNRHDVVLDGNRGGLPLRRSNFVPEIIAVSASNVTLADMTVRYARDHGGYLNP